MQGSLIISVYKNTKALKCILDGLKFQSNQSFEIIISEDGQSKVMGDFIATYNFQHPFQHLTQKDSGWRKNKALNTAVKKSRYDYLIFIDGDCILHHKFIENHFRFSASQRILAGKRVKLGPVYSKMICENIDQLVSFEKRIIKEMQQVKNDGASFFEEAFYFNPDGFLGFLPRIRKMRQLKGCNMSFFKEAIESINGFDEDYLLPAIGEDIDLTWRFFGKGYHLHSLRNLAVQYHLFHKENWVEQKENQFLMETKQKNEEYVCKNGLIKR